ncbi:type IV pilin protein [Duganella sp. Root1480D1]|uniref:type IV pilin protein n=1 Tax=Duganella sp. Root1480D1 TaxID=1736471 RepID=UPI0026C5CD77|nr:type IV pilin protein [Duganella sp. Root1480D1]
MNQIFKHRSSGFTLIELMVTIAIIAVLAAIALPSYKDYVIRGHIPQATNGLADMRIKLEQFFQDNRTYAGACDKGAAAAPSTNPDFTFTCNIAADGMSYGLKAEGKGPMNGFTYEVNESNARKTSAVPTGWSTSNTCWVTATGGRC